MQVAAEPLKEEEDELPVCHAQGEPELQAEQTEAPDPVPAARKVTWCKGCRHA